jgi:hypothetical protein
MLKALKSCAGYPSVILQLEDLQEDLTRFTYKLYAMLGRAGVSGLQMPARLPLWRQFGKFFKARNRTVSSSTPGHRGPGLTQSQVRCNRPWA